MTRIIADEELRSRLETGGEVVEVCSEDGTVLGYFHQAGPRAPSAAAIVSSPYSLTEMIEFDKLDRGRPLAEILRDLEGR